jgi:hypothetical protein
LSGLQGISGPADIRIWPGVITDGWVFIHASAGTRILEIEVYDARGKMINTGKSKEDAPEDKVFIPETKGIYFIKVKSSHGEQTRKVLRM